MKILEAIGIVLICGLFVFAGVISLYQNDAIWEEYRNSK
jgi:hypothetical protein